MPWKTIFQNESQKKYFLELKKKLACCDNICPGYENIFRALKLTELENVKIVILGQDPYHGENQANGLAFAVNANVEIPPSLKNIFREINAEYDKVESDRTLEFWAKQGVLLLNTILSVELHKPLSHAHIGWEQFTDKLIESISALTHAKVFMLWGQNAQSKVSMIKESDNTLILTTSHPSPLSVFRGFAGCNHFKKANNFLHDNGIDVIKW